MKHVGLFLIALTLAMVALVGCEGADSQTRQFGEWKFLGQVSDGGYASSVWKRTDPDTGATIYLSTRGSVTVISAQK
jgi:hypothetical protein